MVFRRHNRKKTAGEPKASTADVPALFLDGAGSQWFLLAFLLYALGAVCQFLGMDPRDDLVRLLRMEPGTVCILFPEDAHAPGLDVCGSSHVQKLIAKVRVV